ncbi:YfbM family protein [Klenkia brasiliensis]|uniref:DUF1877 family protein n=1 Tax=Klenkia brasiliensis TaxID=333142 RepID=A0A1G7XYT1_9ACTN|nr:YfbM family protein [Klenkia brasiliensis]SDG89382.1 protein of unknown function [Klenkia brasiliensis]
MLWTAVRMDPDQLDAVRADPGRWWDLLESDGEDVVDLDKAWRGVHVLLNGDIGDVTTPAGAAFFGGEPLGPDGGDADAGYGAARVLAPDEVLAAARALRGLDLLQLLTRFDPQAWGADGVYPSGWTEGDAHAYLLPALQQLREFLTAAAREGQAVVGGIC